MLVIPVLCSPSLFIQTLTPESSHFFIAPILFGETLDLFLHHLVFSRRSYVTHCCSGKIWINIMGE